MHTIATHSRPDADGICGIDLMQRFGEPIIPGVSRAKVEFWGSLPTCFPDSITASELETKGIIRIDDGLGRFDEHLPNGERKVDEQNEQECSASLVAKAIGCGKHPVAAQIVAMVRECDTKGDRMPFGFPALIKTIGKTFNAGHKTFAWAKTVLDAIYGQGESVFSMSDDEKMKAGKRWSEFLSIWLLTRFSDFLGACQHPDHEQEECPDVAQRATECITMGIPDDIFVKLGISDRNGRSPATQIAEKLELEGDLALEKILNFTARRYEKSCSDAWELCSLADALFLSRTAAAEMWDWLALVLDGIWKRELAFVEDACRDFKKARVLPIMIPNGGGRLRRATMAAGISECDEFGRFARSRLGCEAAVVIQQKSTGNMAILADYRSRILLDEVAAVVRVEENRVRNRKGTEPTRPIPKTFRVLGAPGTIPECPEWHLWSSNGNHLGLFNGTSTHEKPASNLSLDRMPDLVQIGANPQYFEPRRGEDCRRGFCTSTNSSRCPWDAYQLPRCQKVRDRMRK